MSVRGSKHIFIYYRPHLFWRWNYMFLNGAVFNHKEHLFWDQRAVLNYCLPFSEFCIVCLHASCLGSALSTHLLSASDGFIWRGPAKLTGQMIFFSSLKSIHSALLQALTFPDDDLLPKDDSWNILSLRAEKHKQTCHWGSFCVRVACV